MHSTQPSIVCVRLFCHPAGVLPRHSQYGARPLAADEQGHFFMCGSNSSRERTPEASSGEAPPGHKLVAPQLQAAFAQQTTQVSSVQL